MQIHVAPATGLVASPGKHTDRDFCTVDVSKYLRPFMQRESICAKGAIHEAVPHLCGTFMVSEVQLEPSSDRF